MKKFLLAATVLLAFVLSACSPVAAGFAQKVVELPSPLQLAILSGVTFVVGFIFSKIAEAVPFLGEFLGQYVDEVSVALGGAVVLAVQNWLNAIPPQWEGVAAQALALLVEILAAYGLVHAIRTAQFAWVMRKA